jgi:hypothetical protein
MLTSGAWHVKAMSAQRPASCRKTRPVSHWIDFYDVFTCLIERVAAPQARPLRTGSPLKNRPLHRDCRAPQS